MCLFLCANRTVHEWLNAVTAVAEREVLQTKASIAAPESAMSDRETLSESIVKKLPRGQMLRDDHWSREEQARNDADHLFESRKNPLDAISHAWARLLVLVGLRR